jgi:WD40 repeat protein
VFHPTLPLLVAGCDDNAAHVFNIALPANMPIPPEFGKPIQSLPHDGPIQSLAISDAGLLVTAAGDKTIRQFRVASDAPIRKFDHPQIVDCVAFDPAGKLLATGCHDGVLRLFDIEKNATAKAIVAHQVTQPENRQYQIYAVAWTPDGKQVLSASYDRSMKLWDAAGGTLVREFKPFAEKEFPKGHRDQVFAAIFTKDGKSLLSGSSDRTIKMWNVADGAVVREFANPKLKPPLPGDSPDAHPGWVYSLCLSPDEKTLYSVGSAARNRGYLAAWNVADGKCLYGEEIANGPLYSVEMSLDGQALIVGLGPKDRMNPISEAMMIPLPPK